MNNVRNLPRLMVFAVVAKRGSFTQAAAELGTTKSAVSQQVKLLENEIGERVLNRTTRGVALTALGEKILLRCELLQDQVNLVFSDIANAGIAPKGRFAVTFPHALASNVVVPSMEQLCTEFPGLEPELLVSDSTMDLVTNSLDVAIHAGELPDSSYRALPIGMMAEIFCASPLYLNRTSTPKTAEDLCEHRWIATSWQHRNVSITRIGSQERTSLNLTRFAQVNTMPCAIEMALHHMGIVLLPDVAAKPLLQSGELVHLVSGVTGPNWPVHTLHAYQNEKPIHITRFHQLVCRHFSGLTL
ncbi:MAG: LysR family transcriptional regulator [Burkholderiales bacterium RIFOXYD12_FULL_59_19]|nr:MAG: LysR family transcriptional regulator [Burkholderiales bacterium RIFOXYD12_FULL_59_19]